MRKSLKWQTAPFALRMERLFREVSDMHANRNKKAVKRVEQGMMKANRIRNLFAVFAIVLTTFMITTVFSLGINYMENMKLMQVRTAGTTANASLAMPTAEQEQQIKNLEYVKAIGTQYMVGSVAEKNEEGRDLSIALSYYDTTEWDKHYKETIKDIEGNYPSNENEIMLSEDALSQLGMKEPKLNMEIPLSYYDKNGQQEKKFHFKRMVSFLYRDGNGLCFRSVLQKGRLYNGRGRRSFFVAE